MVDEKVISFLEENGNTWVVKWVKSIPIYLLHMSYKSYKGDQNNRLRLP